MAQAATEHGVLELDLEPRRRADAADRRPRAAEHQRAGQEPPLGPARDEVAGRAQRGERALLVEDAGGVDRREGSQHERVPMVLAIVETPQRRPDRLAAELLRERDAYRIGLALAV